MNRTNEELHRGAGAAEPADRAGQGSERATTARGARKARMDLAQLRETGSRMMRQVNEQTRKRPYVALGAASAVGFVAGSLLGTRLGQTILAAGVGYVIKHLLEGDLGFERLQENLGKLAEERVRA